VANSFSQLRRLAADAGNLDKKRSRQSARIKRKKKGRLVMGRRGNRGPGEWWRPYQSDLRSSSRAHKKKKTIATYKVLDKNIYKKHDTN
jgi:hypothetical protein